MKKVIEITTETSEAFLGKSFYVAGLLVIFAAQAIMGFGNVGVTPNDNILYKYSNNVTETVALLLAFIALFSIYVPMIFNLTKHMGSIASVVSFLKPYLYYNMGLIISLYAINAFVDARQTDGKIGVATLYKDGRKNFNTFLDVVINTLTITLKQTLLFDSKLNLTQSNIIYVILAVAFLK